MAGARMQGRYGLAVLIALLALCPNTVLTTAYGQLLTDLARDLDASQLALQVVEGLSNAGLSVGAVVGAYLAQRFVQRQLFLGYATVFVVASVAAAAAPGVLLFGAGRTLQGLATGMMVVSALPALVTRFGVARLPLSVAIVNVALFGSTTAGPLVAGPVAVSGQWRALFFALALLGAAGLAATLAGYPRFEPPAPGLRLDRPAMSLALAATFLPFLATSLLTGYSLTSPEFVVPFVLGLAALFALVTVEYLSDDPLMPVRALSSQLPVTGTVVAMVAGAVFVSVLGLLQLFLSDVARRGPVTAGLLFWPMPVGLLVAAVLFGVLFRSRFVLLLVLAGMAALVAGTAWLLLAYGRGPQGVVDAVPAAAALLGFGAGATVSPGLFLAGLGVPSARLGRAFALVMLLRAAASYAVAPVVLHTAQGAANLSAGVRSGLVGMLVLAVTGLVLAVVIPALSGARLRAPDLRAWLEHGGQALPSPVTAVHVRPGRRDDTAAALLPRLRRRDR